MALSIQEMRSPLARMPFRVFICQIMPTCSLSVSSCGCILSSPPGWDNRSLDSHVPHHKPHPTHIPHMIIICLLHLEVSSLRAGPGPFIPDPRNPAWCRAGGWPSENACVWMNVWAHLQIGWQHTKFLSKANSVRKLLVTSCFLVPMEVAGVIWTI